MTTSASSDPFAQPPEAVVVSLSSSAQGLSSAAADERRIEAGPNRIADAKRQHLVWEFAKRFRNPLVLVLLFAAALAAGTGDPASFVIIACIVVASVLLDFIQERKAQVAVEKLRERVALMVNVLRDGHVLSIRATELVPGDVISLEAGDLVPADCRLLASGDLFVNQSLLTGEAYPAEKEAEALREVEKSVVPKTAVFAGSSIVSGTAQALVVYTGRHTMLGNIAGSLRREPPPTAFALGLRDFSMLILRLTVLLVLFVLLINLLFHRPLLESFLFALALAVGLTPELLPMIVSVTLSHGALRMAEKQVIVKRLSAIHDLGSVDVVCSDKTGTLTEAMIVLVRTVDLDGRDRDDVLAAACINASFETGLKSPLDEAILHRKADIRGWAKLDEVPFDFERRRVSVLAAKGDLRQLFVKGAPEDILELSSLCVRNGKTVPLGDANLLAAQTALEDFGRQGFRTLGIAWRDVDKACSHAGIADEAGLTFGGFALFLDPPKQSAAAALQDLASLGITVKIVTGDNEHVTTHVCESLCVEAGDLLTGEQVACLSDDALTARVRTANRFCRVNPAQKARVIAALRRAGHVVAYLGDGINDAPSLHAADVGISVKGAADIAKEAADMILLQNDLDVLAEGVREGRRTFANVMKYIMMGTSSNFGNMFSMAGGVLVLPFLPMLPIQILLNNLLYDISEIAIPTDRVDEEAIARPGRWDMASVRRFMLLFGPISSVFDFVTFGVLRWAFRAESSLFHTGWFLESLFTQVLVIFIIRTGRPFFASRPSPFLVASSLGTLTVALLVPYTPLAIWLHFVAPPLPVLAALFAITATYLGATDLAKRRIFRPSSRASHI
jgi:Mg2+-importing ATPase